jgi:hypothetical protein
MIHKTTNETTPNLYEAADSLVSVRVLDNCQRFPKHDNHQMVVFRFTPTNHSRIRHLGNNIYEFMPENEAIGAFVSAFQRVNGKFPLTSGEPLRNKPIARKLRWDKFNKRRFAPRRFFGHTRRSR